LVLLGWGESQQRLSYPTNLHVRFDERAVKTEPFERNLLALKLAYEGLR
jgi:hypothetical protein